MQVAKFLEDKNVPYQKVRHRPTASATRLAEIIHMPGREVSKSVVVYANRIPVLLILPSNRRIDFKALSDVLGTDDIRLADEVEFECLLPDCERGAIPPFGSQYDIRTILDSSLTNNTEMVFEGNHHDEAFRIKCEDFIRAERPEIARFSR